MGAETISITVRQTPTPRLNILNLSKKSGLHILLKRRTRVLKHHEARRPAYVCRIRQPGARHALLTRSVRQ